MNGQNKFISKLYREENIKEITRKINCLGNDAKMSASDFLNSRIISTIFVFFSSLIFFKNGYIYAPFLAILYYYLFYYCLITYPLKKRVAKLDREALQFFEILTLTLKSGRNLEQSLRVTCDNVDNEISDEFKKSLFEIDFGKSLMEALNDMKKRMPSEAVNNIILNITQTSQFGNSILETMYNQIDFLREKQILDIKGRINKIPNKVSIISVIFIVPLIMILILGPYLIDFIS